MANILTRILKPRWPAAAVGLTGEGAAVVALDRRRDALAVRRAGYVPLPEGLVRPGFDESNVADVGELADALGELVRGTGLLKRRRWSVALPEAATRTAILTLESEPGSRGELDEMLRWKTERTFGHALDELRVSRERLRTDAQGRARYLAAAVRLSVLAEYEAAFEALGWQAGLILPRHMGEAWWLMKQRTPADALLVSAHAEGFTAVLLRAGQPLLVRSIVCEPEDRTDELYRFLLFYRDRVNAQAEEEGIAPDRIAQLLVAGTGLEPQDARALVAETLDAAPRLVDAEDVRLALPSRDLDFNLIAAPAGLAALAWA
jgi:Tfp pilus assembly PilM family ATPase